MNGNREKSAAPGGRTGDDSAPVIARGGGTVAKKIITLARKNGVPVHEDRDVIEILSTIDLYEDIPMELYKAVAEILAFIYKTSGRL